MSDKVFSQEEIAMLSRQKKEQQQRKQLELKRNADLNANLVDSLKYAIDLFFKCPAEFPALAKQCQYEARRFYYGDYFVSKRQMSEPMYFIFYKFSCYDLNAEECVREFEEDRTVVDYDYGTSLFVTQDGQVIMGKYQEAGSSTKSCYLFQEINKDNFFSILENSICSSSDGTLSFFGEFEDFFKFVCDYVEDGSVKTITSVKSKSVIQSRIKKHFQSIISAGPFGHTESEYKHWKNTKSDGCYIATAVYGSYTCSEVLTLRRFRDSVLSKTWYGCLFIHLYYAVSPKAVRFFGSSRWFQKFFRSMLDPIVDKLKSYGY